MGIRATVTSDFQAADLTRMSDDMLSQVVTDFAADRFLVANQLNRAAAGENVAHAAAVNGRAVSAGKAATLPKPVLRTAVKGSIATTRRAPIVTVDWLWDRLAGSALEKAVAAYARADATLGQITSAAEFAQIVMNPAKAQYELFRYLLARYARYRFPTVFARADAIDDKLAYAKRLYRIYRAIRLGEKLLGLDGKGGGDADVLAWIASELRDRSPVISGDYRDSHELYADGEMIANAADVTEDMDLPEAEEFSFTNTVPYSRKIEMGVTKAGRAFVVQVEPYIYERVADEAQSRFASLAEIAFEMRGIVAGEQVGQMRAHSYGQPWWLGGAAPRAASGVRESRIAKVHGKTAHNRAKRRYPSIVVRFK